MRFLLFFIFSSLLVNAQTVSVAVAANLSYAIKTLQKAYLKHHPESKIEIILGSTGKLTALIKNGAPYDILMGADMAYPNSLYKEGVALEKPYIYAKGSLILFTKKERDLTEGVKKLTDSEIKKIAIANPQTAPYGKASIEALTNANILKNVKSKLIYAQSASQAITYTLKVADIGFIPKSTLYAPKMRQYKKGKNWIDVPKRLYKPIEQGMILLKHAKENQDAQNFYNFLLTQEAKKIFKAFGYIVE